MKGEEEECRAEAADSCVNGGERWGGPLWGGSISTESALFKRRARRMIPIERRSCAKALWHERLWCVWGNVVKGQVPGAEEA